MNLPERVASIRPGDRVLEIGPGSFPHPRADHFLERRFNDEQAHVQCGNAAPAHLTKPCSYYQGGAFPFQDHQFDYAICSHVLEHVPAAELDTFVSELSRVATRGYLEVPSVFYEFMCFPEPHRWFINFREGELLLLPREAFTSNWIHRIYREMVYCRDGWPVQVYRRYRELFFIGFEWTGGFRVRRVSTFDELVNEADFRRFQAYFAAQPAARRQRRPVTLARHYAAGAWQRLRLAVRGQAA